MTESARAGLIRRYWELCWNDRRVELLSEVFHEDYTHGRTPYTPRQLADIVRGTVAAIPDLRVEVEELAEIGSAVVTRCRFRGTHGGELLGLAGTGRPLEAPSLDVFFFREERVERMWHQFDHLPLLQGMAQEVRADGAVVVFD